MERVDDLRVEVGKRTQASSFQVAKVVPCHRHAFHVTSKGSPCASQDQVQARYRIAGTFAMARWQ